MYFEKDQEWVQLYNLTQQICKERNLTCKQFLIYYCDLHPHSSFQRHLILPLSFHHRPSKVIGTQGYLLREGLKRAKLLYKKKLIPELPFASLEEIFTDWYLKNERKLHTDYGIYTIYFEKNKLDGFDVKVRVEKEFEHTTTLEIVKQLLVQDIEQLNDKHLTIEIEYWVIIK